jgi:hypothetical protein
MKQMIIIYVGSVYSTTKTKIFTILKTGIRMPAYGAWLRMFNVPEINVMQQGAQLS